MLISFEHLVKKYKLDIDGILHIGAHECEERNQYNKYVNDRNIYWVDALPDKVCKIKQVDNNIQIYQALIDVDNDNDVLFNVANNGQSSSILEFGTHAKHHPDCRFIDVIKLKSIRLDTFIEVNGINMNTVNFMNLDIQGKELDAIKSMGSYLKNIDYIYTEVNTEHVYKNCCLLEEIDSYLYTFGFERVECVINGNCGWGDAFYVKKQDSKIEIITSFLKRFDYDITRKIQNKNKLAIIIEPRRHPRLKTTIVNVLSFLGDEYDLLFIGSSVSIYHIHLQLPGLEMYTEIINKLNINWAEYSELLMNRELLTKYSNYENVFVFQTDSILLKPLDNSIYDMDYCGASDQMVGSESENIIIYNGGISFRKMSFMLYCLNNISLNYINSIRDKLGYILSGDVIPEDFYYSQCLSIKLYNTIKNLDIENNKFFGQNRMYYDKDKIGAIHAYNRDLPRLLSIKQIKELLSIYSESKLKEQ